MKSQDTILSGLPLRKAALEALGWRPDVDLERSNPEHLPSIESDPAVSIPTLQELCIARGWAWVVGWDCELRQNYCHIYEGFGQLASTLGATPSEAIARTIVAAAQTKKTHV